MNHENRDKPDHEPEQDVQHEVAAIPETNILFRVHVQRLSHSGGWSDSWIYEKTPLTIKGSAE